MEPPDSRKTTQQMPCRSKRRKYNSHACAECRRRKVKCSGGTPCANCIVTTSACRYEERLKQCRKKRAAAVSVGYREQYDAGGMMLRMRALEEEVHVLRLALGADQPSNERRIRPIGSDQLAPMGTYDSEVKNQERIDRLSVGIHVPSSMAAQLQIIRNVAPQRAYVDVPENNKFLDIPTAGYLPSLLADTTRMKTSVRLFFNESVYMFPCLQLDEFCPRLFKLFQMCPSGSYGLLLSIEREDEISLAALSCMILAAAELIRTDGPLDSVDYHTHQTWYQESQRLLRLHPKRPLRDLDILCTYVVESLYKLGLEQLSEASHAITQAVELAFALGLNNERCWPVQAEAGRKQSRMLWWSLYVLDRSVAHKIGRPYLIRDSDAAVADFLGDINRHDPSAESQPRGDGRDQLSGVPAVSRECLDDRDWYWYLQFHVQWGRLFSRIWDSNLAPQASQVGDTEVIEALDSSVLRLRRSIPFSLNLETCPASIVPERKARLQLLIYTRINVLRLLIRGSGLRGNHSSSTFDPIHNSVDWEYNMRLCQDLATSTIDSIIKYMRVRPFERVMGIYSTLVLLQCLYYIVHFTERWPSTNGCILRDKYIETTSLCLQEMAATGLKIAQHSLNVLRGGISLQRSVTPPSSTSSNDDSIAKRTDTSSTSNSFLSNYPHISLHDSVLESRVTNPAMIDLYKCLGLTGADL